MAKPQKALLSFGKYADSAVITACRFIIAAMTGNANFPDPKPALPGLVTLLEDYSKALNACGTHDRNKIAIKNALRVQLDEGFNQLGAYVNMICTGNTEMLVSSGFKLSKIPEPVRLEVPTGLVVTRGINPGTLKAKVKAVPGASGYLFDVCEDATIANPVWVSHGCVRSKCVITNLVAGKIYYIRVIALGAKDQSTCSTVAMQVAAV